MRRRHSLEVHLTELVICWLEAGDMRARIGRLSPVMPSKQRRVPCEDQTAQSLRLANTRSQKNGTLLAAVVPYLVCRPVPTFSFVRYIPPSSNFLATGIMQRETETSNNLRSCKSFIEKQRPYGGWRSWWRRSLSTCLRQQVHLEGILWNFLRKA